MPRKSHKNELDISRRLGMTQEKPQWEGGFKPLHTPEIWIMDKSDNERPAGQSWRRF